MVLSRFSKAATHAKDIQAAMSMCTRLSCTAEACLLPDSMSTQEQLWLVRQKADRRGR